MTALWAAWGLALAFGLLATLGFLGRWGDRLLIPTIAAFIMIGLVLSYASTGLTGLLRN